MSDTERGVSDSWRIHRTAAVRFRKPRRRREPIQTTYAHPAALRVAHGLAERLGRKVRVESDGSVYVR